MCGSEGYQVPAPAEKWNSKASVRLFSYVGLAVNHISSGGEPPMSNRVVALNSFVPPVRTVASVLLLDRVVALMEKSLTDLPALLSVVAVETEVLPRRDASGSLPWIGYAAAFGRFL